MQKLLFYFLFCKTAFAKSSLQNYSFPRTLGLKLGTAGTSSRLSAVHPPRKTRRTKCGTKFEPRTIPGLSSKPFEQKGA